MYMRFACFMLVWMAWLGCYGKESLMSAIRDKFHFEFIPTTAFIEERYYKITTSGLRKFIECLEERDDTDQEMLKERLSSLDEYTADTQKWFNAFNEIERRGGRLYILNMISGSGGSGWKEPFYACEIDGIYYFFGYNYEGFDDILERRIMVGNGCSANESIESISDFYLENFSDSKIFYEGKVITGPEEDVRDDLGVDFQRTTVYAEDRCFVTTWMYLYLYNRCEETKDESEKAMLLSKEQEKFDIVNRFFELIEEMDADLFIVLPRGEETSDEILPLYSFQMNGELYFFNHTSNSMDSILARNDDAVREINARYLKFLEDKKNESTSER